MHQSQSQSPKHSMFAIGDLPLPGVSTPNNLEYKHQVLSVSTQIDSFYEKSSNNFNFKRVSPQLNRLSYCTNDKQHLSSLTDSHLSLTSSPTIAEEADLCDSEGIAQKNRITTFLEMEDSLSTTLGVQKYVSELCQNPFISSNQNDLSMQQQIPLNFEDLNTNNLSPNHITQSLVTQLAFLQNQLAQLQIFLPQLQAQLPQNQQLKPVATAPELNNLYNQALQAQLSQLEIKMPQIIQNSLSQQNNQHVATSLNCVNCFIEAQSIYKESLTPSNNSVSYFNSVISNNNNCNNAYCGSNSFSQMLINNNNRNEHNYNINGHCVHSPLINNLSYAFPKSTASGLEFDVCVFV